MLEENSSQKGIAVRKEWWLERNSGQKGIVDSAFIQWLSDIHVTQMDSMHIINQ